MASDVIILHKFLIDCRHTTSVECGKVESAEADAPAHAVVQHLFRKGALAGAPCHIWHRANIEHRALGTSFHSNTHHNLVVTDRIHIHLLRSNTG